MIPKIGDTVYFVYYGKICIFEVLNVGLTETSIYPLGYKFELCVLSGDWPFSYLFVDASTLTSENRIAEIEPGAYLIFDEETFVNFVKTYEITGDWG